MIALDAIDPEDGMRDAADVLFVVRTLLIAEPGPLTAEMRDALATVLRLGGDRLARARTALVKAGADTP